MSPLLAEAVRPIYVPLSEYRLPVRFMSAKAVNARAGARGGEPAAALRAKGSTNGDKAGTGHATAAPSSARKLLQAVRAASGHAAGPSQLPTLLDSLKAAAADPKMIAALVEESAGAALKQVRAPGARRRGRCVHAVWLRLSRVTPGHLSRCWAAPHTSLHQHEV
jgi:hypothetical protein